MTKAGRAFQSETTRFDKKSSLGVKFVTSCRLILCEWPLILLAGPCDERKAAGEGSLIHVTLLKFLTILKYWIKSPLRLLCESEGIPIAFNRSSYLAHLRCRTNFVARLFWYINQNLNFQMNQQNQGKRQQKNPNILVT